MRRVASLLLFCTLAASSLSCSALKEIANLRNLVFSLDRIADVQLADVPLANIKAYDDLQFTEVARLGRAVVNREIPLSFDLNIGAENPPENNVQARMVRMDWTLLLEDTETISGIIDDEFLIPAGGTATIPLSINLELFSFFDKSAKDLVDLALSLSGAGGEPKNIKIRALPTINTPLGPIRYSDPITIVSKTVG
ncbi:MAG: hypothetical protein HKN43_00565 [Rhodothermales bacterium]|nr:hypothetical protein [Rhodothermales bacterium]